MSGSSNPKTRAGVRKGDAARAERLRAALRENLKRRKSQARGRSQTGPGETGPETEPVPAHDSAGIVQEKAQEKAKDKFKV
jgi:hypothetical protein